jgi:hypothetical protein
MQCISAARVTPNLNLPAFEFSLANITNPLIIERIPSSKSISRAQDGQSIIEFEMGDHSAKRTLLVAPKETIGPLDDCVIR